MKKLNRGSSIIGYLDNKFRFNILDEIDFSNKEVIFITGTNGKTTITNALNDIYVKNGIKVLSNLEGANLVSGISNSIIMNLKGKELPFNVLLLEVDEKNIKLISKKIKPNHIILTNFFRDQLDRYFEINLVLEEILQTIKLYNPNVYINGQDPLVNTYFKEQDFHITKFSLDKTDLEDRDNVKEIKYCPKCKKKLSYDYYHYSHIGNFYCKTCDFKVNNINHSFSYLNNELSFLSNDKETSLCFTKDTPLYLIINYCVILNFCLKNNLVTNKTIASLEQFTMPKGRNNKLIVNDKELYLTLAKNVVGMEQSINYLLKNYTNINLLIAFNDNYADSLDVSWIWDIKFKKLFPILNSLIIVGKRSHDMELRFLYEGYENITVFSNIPEGVDEILKLDNPVIICNYTPLKEINKYLLTLK